VRPALTVLAGIVLAIAGCGGSGSTSPSAAQSARPAVQDLQSIAPIKDAFNADAGRSRLVLIFSPT
jgi:hypothetical protein